MVLNAICFLFSSLIANMATILIHFQQKFTLVRSFQHFAIKFLNHKRFLARFKVCLHCAYKITKFLRSYVEGVCIIQNGACERNGLTAYSVGGHNIVLNCMTEIANLLQFFVVSVKFGSDYASTEVVLSF